jgi:hypothetical protein
MKKRLSLNDQALVIGGIQGEVQDSFSAEGHRVLLQRRSVDIEPVFHSFTLNTLSGNLSSFNLQQRPDPRKVVRVVYMQLWFRCENKLRWQEVDFLRELSMAKNPISFMILGNKTTIAHVLAVDLDEVSIVKNVLKARFPTVECDIGVNPFLKFSKVLDYTSSSECSFGLRDYYPYPEYWRNLILDENIKSSPLVSLYTGLSSLGNDELGIYQVIIKPTVYPWSKNILSLIEVEAEIARYGKVSLSRCNYPDFGNKERNKCKLDSPIVAVATRCAVVSRRANIEDILNTLSLVFRNFQFSGENLNYMDKTDYKGIINTPEQLISWIAAGIVYHSGFLFNTRETLGFFHFPIEEVLKNENYPLDRITGFRVPQELRQAEGVVLGYSDYAGERVIVTQPERVRKNHTAIIGRIDQGKSAEMVNMGIDDIRKGRGVAFFDSHGPHVHKLARKIERKDIERTVYLTFCDDEYVPCCNFLKDGKNIDKTVDDNVLRFKYLYPANAWGQSIEDILRRCFYAIAVTPGLSLSDVRTLLAKNSEGEKLRHFILPFLKNKEEELFWKEDFKHIVSIERVASKLTLFLQPERARRIFSQKENKINFREIIDNGMILLVDLRSGILGNDLTNILGSCLFSSFYNAAMSRMDLITDETSDTEIGAPFNLYIDEFHRYPTKSLEHSLRELRKFNVRLILAFQQKEYMNEAIKSAMGNIGTWIVLSLGWEDAQQFFKEFYGMVDINSLMRRTTGNAYLKVADYNIVNMKTFGPPKEIGKGFLDEIKQNSFERYYTKVSKDTGNIVTREAMNKKRAMYDEI